MINLNPRTPLGDMTLDACMDCTLYISTGAVPAERPDLPDAVKRRFPAHQVVLADDDPDPFSTLPCGCCFTGVYGARQRIVFRRQLRLVSA